MGSKRPQTYAKRARELAVKERRELKRAKKAAAAAERAANSEQDENATDIAAGTEAEDSADGSAPNEQGPDE